jgi:1,4-dihydroxy-2-naphthoate octaprenyltransferase
MLQGTGRAFFLEGLDQHPQVREQVLAKVPDATMFVTTIRNLGVVKILPDQIDITDDTNLGLGPRPAYTPAGALALPGRRLRWLYALRVSSWPASLVPILIGALLALDVPAGVHGWLVIPLAVAVLLIQVGTILVNTADDRIRGRKRPEDLGASRVLLDGLLPVHPVFRVGMLCIGIGAIIGLFLAELRGLPLLLMGLVGTLSGFLYAGWPIRPRWSGMDEGIVFVCMGPLLVLSSFFVLTGVYRHSALLISLPIGLLAEAMFHGNQLKAFADGAQAKTPALAMALGWMGSRLMYGALIVLPYILVLLLVLLVIVPEWTLLVFVSGPLAAWAALSVRGTPPRETQALASLERPAMWLHLAFGLLLALGLVLGSGGELTRALSDLGAELIP